MAVQEPEFVRLLQQEIGDKVSYLGEQAPKEYFFQVDPANLVEVSSFIHEKLRAPLVVMTGTDEREMHGQFRLYYVFSVDWDDAFLTLLTGIDPVEPRFPSITPVIPAAHWYEREVMDMLGLEPVGHPDPRRLVLHHDWPLGTHPLRKDFDLSKVVLNPPSTDYIFSEVRGDGAFFVPVGPIHAGIIEPGHFRFGAAGETVINLEARLFYTHRGLEKQCEGLPVERALVLAERICGVCAYTHATAFCQAIEKIAEVELPLRAKYLRTIFLELERLYNHIGDVGNICAGVGLAFGSSHGGRLKETLMQLNERLTGSRFLRGVNIPGGVRRDLSLQQQEDLSRTLAKVGEDFREVTEILLNHESMLDRLNSTGVLPLQAVEDLGVVGPAARASGSGRDCRRDHPHLAYDEVEFKVPVYQSGDVLARMRVRLDETVESLGIIRQLLAKLPGTPGELMVDPGDLPPYRAALGYAESPRGDDYHWVMTGPDNTIFRYRIRSASYCNWPAVPLAVPGNIVPDFPLINKSFELCYSCLDR